MEVKPIKVENSEKTSVKRCMFFSIYSAIIYIYLAKKIKIVTEKSKEVGIEKFAEQKHGI